MRRDVYERLASVLSSIPASAWPHYELLAKRYGVSVEAVTSINIQAAQLHVKRNHTAFESDITVYAARYQAGEELLDLCDVADMPPCMFLRRLLEQPPWACGRQAVTRILKNPTSAAEIIRMSAAGERVPQHMIADIKLCLECDQVYSPSADAKRHCIGVEYERKLESCLSLAKLAFNTEEHLRIAGAYKTPDAHLQVPFAVKDKIVNWIDSKATFGDDHLHREQTKQQYSKYINRYGSGMVIYWFGFIDDLQENVADLVLTDVFPAPEDIMQLACLPVPSDLLPLVNDNYRTQQDMASDIIDTQSPRL